MLGCPWNFRPDHCLYGLNCAAAKDTVREGRQERVHAHTCSLCFASSSTSKPTIAFLFGNELHLHNPASPPQTPLPRHRAYGFCTATATCSTTPPRTKGCTKPTCSRRLRGSTSLFATPRWKQESRPPISNAIWLKKRWASQDSRVSKEPGQGHASPHRALPPSHTTTIGHQGIL